MNCALGAVALYCPLGAVALGLARWALWRCGAVEWHYSATALNTAWEPFSGHQQKAVCAPHTLSYVVLPYGLYWGVGIE